MNALFRKNAMEQAGGAQEHDDALRLTPEWTGWAYWLIVGARSVTGETIRLDAGQHLL